MTLSGLRLLDAGIGVIKDILLTRSFGLGAFLDAYFIVIGILDIFSGYFQMMGYSILTPVYNDIATENPDPDEVEARQNRWITVFLNNVLLSMVVFAAATCLLHLPIGKLIAPKLMAQHQQTLSTLIMIVLPISMIFQGSYALRVILIQKKRFAGFHLPGILSTLVFILLFVVLYPSQGFYAVMWAMPLSYGFQFLYYWALLGIDWQPIWRHEAWSKVSKLIGPNLLNWFFLYMVVPVDNYFLGYLPSGELSAYRFAFKMITVLSALTVFNLQMTRVPLVMTAGSQKDWPTMKALILKGIWESVLFSLPIWVGLYLLGPVLIQVLFQRDAFTAQDTELVAYCLRILMFSLPFIGSFMILSRCFESLYLLRPYALISGIALILRIGMDAVGLKYFGLAGVAWMSISQSYLMLFILLAYLHWRMNRQPKAAL